VGAAVAAEAHLRLAFTAPGPELDEHVAQALAAEPAGAPVGLVVEALQALGRDRDLADVLARRDQDGDGDRQLWRLRAEVLERLGAVDEAAALYGDLVAAYPDDVAALKALAGLYRRPGRSGELAGVLERLWALATAPQGARDLDGETRAVGLELAELLAGPLGDAARAEEILRAVLHAFPDDPRALEALSDRLAARGADDEADALLLRLAALAGGIGRVGERVVRLARRPDLPPAKAAALLERALTAVTAPRGDVADALTEVLPRLPDRDERRRALLRLRDRALPLSPQARARLAAALAEVGEVS
jgi:tetratricopeptide (TPR) repeat protein